MRDKKPIIEKSKATSVGGYSFPHGNVYYMMYNTVSSPNYLIGVFSSNLLVGEEVYQDERNFLRHDEIPDDVKKDLAEFIRGISNPSVYPTTSKKLNGIYFGLGNIYDVHYPNDDDYLVGVYPTTLAMYAQSLKSKEFLLDGNIPNEVKTAVTVYINNKKAQKVDKFKIKGQFFIDFELELDKNGLFDDKEDLEEYLRVFFSKETATNSEFIKKNTKRRGLQNLVIEEGNNG